MGLVVTDPLTLHIQQAFRNDVFVQEAANIEDTNKGMRHAAYRQYVLWIYGRLQKDDRRTVPACCVKVIRDKFPSPSGHYTGFIPVQHGIGWWMMNIVFFFLYKKVKNWYILFPTLYIPKAKKKIPLLFIDLQNLFHGLFYMYNTLKCI